MGVAMSDEAWTPDVPVEDRSPKRRPATGGPPRAESLIHSMRDNGALTTLQAREAVESAMQVKEEGGGA